MRQSAPAVTCASFLNLIMMCIALSDAENVSKIVRTTSATLTNVARKRVNAKRPGVKH